MLMINFQTGVRASWSHWARTCAQRRDPVECHVADRHFCAGLCTEARQGVLDTKAREPVGEIADGFVVAEVRLQDPASRPFTVDSERLRRRLLNRESWIPHWRGTQHDARGLCRR